MLIVLSLSGCAEQHKRLTPKAYFKPTTTIQIHYIDVTLIEGKTQKAYVLETLGTPDSFGTSDTYSDTTYRFYNKPVNIKARIHIVQKDGTAMNIVVGKGEKHESFIIYYTLDGIIRNISIN